MICLKILKNCVVIICCCQVLIANKGGHCYSILSQMLWLSWGSRLVWRPSYIPFKRGDWGTAQCIIYLGGGWDWNWNIHVSSSWIEMLFSRYWSSDFSAMVWCEPSVLQPVRAFVGEWGICFAVLIEKWWNGILGSSFSDALRGLSVLRGFGMCIIYWRECSVMLIASRLIGELLLVYLYRLVLRITRA